MKQMRQAALLDRSMRYSSATLELRYDTPGTIFSISRDEKALSIRSLSTGDAAEVRFDSPLAQVSTGTKVSISQNAQQTQSTVSYIRQDSQTIWVKIATTPAATWIVTNDL